MNGLYELENEAHTAVSSRGTRHAPVFPSVPSQRTTAPASSSIAITGPVVVHSSSPMESL